MSDRLASTADARVKLERLCPWRACVRGWGGGG